MWPTDVCGQPQTVVLTSIVSSEPDDAPGQTDGHTVRDIQDADFGTPDFVFKVRAEADRNGPGRIYLVTYTATSLSGQSASAGATIFVPVGGHTKNPSLGPLPGATGASETGGRGNPGNQP